MSVNYVNEKIHVAVECLCGEGSFKKRLEDATVSALTRLEDKDLTGDLSKDLKYILDWTKWNMEGGVIQTEPNEEERGQLIEKMLNVLIETERMVGKNDDPE